MLKSTLSRAIAVLICFLLFIDFISAQVVINEICPSNVSTISNSGGNFDDWIELYNPGSSSINIQGYAITDDIGEPTKFIFPSVILSPSSRIIVFASDDAHVPVDHYEMPVTSGS